MCTHIITWDWFSLGMLSYLCARKNIKAVVSAEIKKECHSFFSFPHLQSCRHSKKASQNVNIPNTTEIENLFSTCNIEDSLLHGCLNGRVHFNVPFLTKPFLPELDCWCLLGLPNVLLLSHFLTSKQSLRLFSCSKEAFDKDGELGKAVAVVMAHVELQTGKNEVERDDDVLRSATVQVRPGAQFCVPSVGNWTAPTRRVGWSQPLSSEPMQHQKDATLQNCARGAPWRVDVSCCSAAAFRVLKQSAQHQFMLTCAPRTVPHKADMKHCQPTTAHYCSKNSHFIAEIRHRTHDVIFPLFARILRRVDLHLALWTEVEIAMQEHEHNSSFSGVVTVLEWTPTKEDATVSQSE